MSSSASTSAEKGGVVVVSRPRIRLINADSRYGIDSSLMPEAACGCDSNNPAPQCEGSDVQVCVSVEGGVNVSGNCGVWG